MTNYEWLLNMGGEERQAWFDAEHVENQNGTLDGARAALDDENDSREKLEADVREFANVYYTSNLFVYDKVIELLDRQAAITRQEFWSMNLSLFEENGRLKEQVDELRAQMVEAARERDYWKQQVQLCMDAAYPQSHSPERRYDPDVMAYPDRNGCTTPSTLVCDVIDGLRYGFQDKMMPILVEAAEAKQDAERWREGYGRILDEIHEIEGIIGGLGER